MTFQATTDSPQALRVAIGQITPVLLDRRRTMARIVETIDQAAAEKCRVIAFGEALLPGYPFWLNHTDAARFDSDLQKRLHARYLQQAVCPEQGDLAPVCEAARRGRLWVFLGAVERAADRGGHSLYCSLFGIDDQGHIRSNHRKLMPTYEERLSWGIGDGAGLRVHAIDAFQTGALNCWENWMPLARAALHTQGENLHVASWPGSRRNTEDSTRFMAIEGRSFVISACGLMPRSAIPDELPGADRMRASAGEWLADGGSAIAGPDGQWVVEPQCGGEELITAELDLSRVLEERQNFDPSGHYSRPDVLSLQVNRQRQGVTTALSRDDEAPID